MTKTFITGPAGTGKTTQALTHLRTLLLNHVPAQNILVLVPQQTLAKPYLDLLSDPALPAIGKVDVVTLSGLSLQTTNLFWPLVADRAGFGRPTSPPLFLTIETSQYYLQQAIAPLLAQGYFGPNEVELTISMPRLMSQILDNLNKAALLGLPHTEVADRLKSALPMEQRAQVALEHTQACVNRFRTFCLARNLLDFSLRIETFYQHLWPVPGIRQFLIARYRHLIIDNLEEDNPFTHTVLHEWLPEAESALVMNDEDAGYRIFLGANWCTARQLEKLCDKTITLTDTQVASPHVLEFGQRMADTLGILETADPLAEADPQQAFHFDSHRFFPQMIDAVVEQVDQLLNDGISPNEVVVLAPFVSDALRFAFLHGMAERNLPARAHRPSRPLRQEPAAKTVLILTRLVFPEWGMLPEPYDVMVALSQAIPDLDPVRARLLVQVVYRQYERRGGVFTTFEQIDGPIRERISYQVGLKFDQLRQWLMEARGDEPETIVLDHFFNRLFGELLSQPEFGYHDQLEAGEVVANLADSARQFRLVAGQVPLNATPPYQYLSIPEINQAYLSMIEQGIFAAQYLRSWDLTGNPNLTEESEAVLIAPATTFLMSNRPVDYQFWLSAGSSGWWERIAQPLTHPYILAADWDVNRTWTDVDEVNSQNDRLYRLITGLTRRCRQKLYIYNAEIGEQGYEQRGQLLTTLQQMLRQWQKN